MEIQSTDVSKDVLEQNLIFNKILKSHEEQF